MRSAYLFIISTTLLFTSACSTLNQSLQLGSGLGAATGAATTYTARKAAGEKPEFSDVATGAGIGALLGMITAHITHRQVEKDRLEPTDDGMDIHFGDLPPNPFTFKNNQKKGQ